MPEQTNLPLDDSVALLLRALEALPLLPDAPPSVMDDVDRFASFVIAERAAGWRHAREMEEDRFAFKARIAELEAAIHAVVRDWHPDRRATLIAVLAPDDAEHQGDDHA